MGQKTAFRKHTLPSEEPAKRSRCSD